MIVHASFSILNPGTIFRWRLNFELIFCFAPMFLFFLIFQSLKMRKIIHFHPNGNYSKKFVDPLQKFEKKLGFNSIIVNDTMASDRNLQIHYILKINNFFKFPLNFILLILHIYRLKPDIIFCHNSTAAWVPMLVARFLFIKNIIYFNHGLPFIGYKGLPRFILYLIEKINCLLSKKIITVSNAMKTELQRITKKKCVFNT